MVLIGKLVVVLFCAVIVKRAEALAKVSELLLKPVVWPISPLAEL
jgi:hypothetical protein